VVQFVVYAAERGRNSSSRASVATQENVRLRSEKGAQVNTVAVVKRFLTSRFSFVRSKKLSVVTDC
jgi:hypothetical protein